MANEQLQTETLLQGAGANAIGNAKHIPRAMRAIGASVAGTGAVSATVEIEGSNLGEAWYPVATFSPAGINGVGVDGEVIESPWYMLRARVTAISGTGAAVTASVGF